MPKGPVHRFGSQDLLLAHAARHAEDAGNKAGEERCEDKNEVDHGSIL